tara:strand:+ start:481 stop:927 length:447 start_codon:yes stop_codon:yes gene_type:complete
MNANNKKLINLLDEMLPPSKFKGVNVLVVDDESFNLTAFKGLFRQHANVFIASNKNEALEVVINNKIDVVFCDYMLPEFKGSEILFEITKLYPLIKKYIVTGYTEPKIIKDIKNILGECEVIYKPYSFEDIRMRILGVNNNDLNRLIQ